MNRKCEKILILFSFSKWTQIAKRGRCSSASSSFLSEFIRHSGSNYDANSTLARIIKSTVTRGEADTSRHLCYSLCSVHRFLSFCHAQNTYVYNRKSCENGYWALAYIEMMFGIFGQNVLLVQNVIARNESIFRKYFGMCQILSFTRYFVQIVNESIVLFTFTEKGDAGSFWKFFFNISGDALSIWNIIRSATLPLLPKSIKSNTMYIVLFSDQSLLFEYLS